MKTKILAHLCAAALLCGNVCAQGDALSIPHISVNGTAKKEVTPDELHWWLEVKNTGLDLPKVAEQHAKKVSAVLDLLKANGIADKNVQTAQMQLGDNQVYRHNENVKEGYLAETQLSFKLEELGKYKTIWFALAGLSEVSVKGVWFDTSKRIELNKEVRKNALKAAKEKAVTMADELGSRVGEPLAIEEDLSISEGWGRDNNILFNGNTVVQTAGGGGGDREGTLAPGSIAITIRVRVTFRLLNPGN
jgi:uncharacterized protein YggE